MLSLPGKETCASSWSSGAKRSPALFGSTAPGGFKEVPKALRDEESAGPHDRGRQENKLRRKPVVQVHRPLGIDRETSGNAPKVAVAAVHLVDSDQSPCRVEECGVPRRTNMSLNTRFGLFLRLLSTQDNRRRRRRQSSKLTQTTIESSANSPST